MDASFVGSVDKDQAALEQDHLTVFRAANSRELEKKGRGPEKHKARGRNKISAKLRRKQKNVVDASTIKLRDKLKAKNTEDAIQIDPETHQKDMRKKHGALLRFAGSAAKQKSATSTSMNTESRRNAF